MKLNEIYKCEVCGNILELVHVGGGELVCCDQRMNLLKENTDDAVGEKHVPIVEKTENGFRVKVGAVEHPMTEDHYIEWIEVICEGGRVCRHYLKPGAKPKATFDVDNVDKARAYCNLHGLWSK